MKHMSLSNHKIGEFTFAKKVKEQCGVDVNRCYQCLTCTLSCPVVFTMDYSPHQLVRMIQLGTKEEVLQSSTIWVCANCETCVTRCPNEIDIPKLMDTFRQMAIQENISGKETTVPQFHQVFMKGIRQWGKQYELGMLIELKLKTRDLFSDLGMGLKLLRKGKLSLLPERIKGYREIKNIFRKTEAKKN
ncbi:4Fe-4S dicluster domain-containing protein [Chloroflexota bacterium]